MSPKKMYRSANLGAKTVVVPTMPAPAIAALVLKWEGRALNRVSEHNTCTKPYTLISCANHYTFVSNTYGCLVPLKMQFRKECPFESGQGHHYRHFRHICCFVATFWRLIRNNHIYSAVMPRKWWTNIFVSITSSDSWRTTFVI